MAVKHAFVSAKVDGPNTSLVRATNWNADHTIDSTGVDVSSAIALNVGTTNATSIVLGKDGIALTHGVVWDDIQGPANQGIGTAALTTEVYRDTPAVMQFMRHDQDDSLTFTYQMPHRWIPNTEVRVHTHWIPMVTPATDQNVRFQCRYAWSHYNTELPTVASWSTSTTDVTVPADGTKTFKEQITTLFTSTPSGSRESSMLVVQFMRLSSSASDSYTTAKASGTTPANVCILAVDAHFQSNKEGTVTEI